MIKKVKGACFYENGKALPAVKRCEFIITNDGHGKTISLCIGKQQFTFEFEPLEKHLK